MGEECEIGFKVGKGNVGERERERGRSVKFGFNEGRVFWRY